MEKWYQILGELRYMAIALPESRCLFKWGTLKRASIRPSHISFG